MRAQRLRTSTESPWSGHLLAMPVLLLAGLGVGVAQGARASLQGAVVDPTGAVVPGAQITLRNTDLGTTRVLQANGSGGFRVEGLPAGAYSVEARGAGLATRHPLRLTLTVGSSQQLRLEAEPTGVKTQAQVNGRGGTVEGNTTAPAVNTTEASLGTFLPGLTVTYLPNRDRDFAQFTALAATAEEDAEGTGLVLNGQRSDDLLTELDGTSFTSPLFGGQRGAGDRALFLPLTAVREFEVVRTGADALTGRSTAGVINVVTKGGANRPRGEAFYTGRPAAFTAADAFGRSLGSVQNAFGGSYGGPLRRDRVFGLVSVERDFLETPFSAAFDPQAPGVVVPGALLALQGPVPSREGPLAGFGRLDWNLGSANTLNLELGLDRIRSQNVGDGLSRSMATAVHAASLSGQSVTARAGLASVLGPRLFSDAVVAWSSDHRNRTPNSTAPEQLVNGFGVLGGSAEGQHLYTAQRTEVVENLTATRGRNAFTVGADASFEPAYEQVERNRNGRFDYDSLADLLANNPRRFRQTLVTGDVRYRGTVEQLGLFAEARAALRPTLFLSAGLRWDAQWNPQPVAPDSAIAITQRIPNDLKQWQPRVGVAWSPDKRTVVRLSTGLYAAPTPATFFHRIEADAGTQTLTLDSDFDAQLLMLSGATAGQPHALASAPALLSTPHAEVVGIAPAFRNPVSAQVAASVDRQFLPKLEATFSYVHNSTWALERQLDTNLAPPSFAADGTPVFLAPRPLAGFGRVLEEQSAAHASYNAGSLSVNAPLSRRSQLLVNYTVARSRDDDSGSSPYSPEVALNPFAPEADRAFSNFDVRQSLNVNAIVNLAAGFKVNPILLARTGLPYTPVVGFDQQNDANDLNDRALIHGAVAPRNLLRQPSFSDLDLRLVKDFTLKGEGHHLDLFADLFNVVGAGNRSFAPDGLDFFGDASHSVFSAGLPLYAPGVARFGGPRTLQLTARLVGF